MDTLLHPVKRALEIPTRRAAQKTGGTSGAVSYEAVSQSLLSQENKVGLSELCQASFARNFGHSAGAAYYHVMDATTITRENWCHEDFPYDRFFTDDTDNSILDWAPERANPSQMASEIQAKVNATLGKSAIIVPPALEEKMKSAPALRAKVAANIDKIYAFHAGGPRLTLPGTKFYGTRLYSAVVVLDENGEVANCRVSSGGGIIGPDEKTLRQIEREQNRQAKRKAENRQLDAKAARKRFEKHRTLQRNDLTSNTTTTTQFLSEGIITDWLSF